LFYMSGLYWLFTEPVNLGFTLMKTPFARARPVRLAMRVLQASISAPQHGGGFETGKGLI
jgi:hypothetical protein